MNNYEPHEGNIWEHGRYAAPAPEPNSDYTLFHIVFILVSYLVSREQLIK